MSLFGGGRDRDRGPRSAQERERARLEREARRRGVPLESLAPEPAADPDPEIFDEPSTAHESAGDRERVHDEVAWEDEPVNDDMTREDEPVFDEPPPGARVEEGAVEEAAPSGARGPDAAADARVRAAASSPVERSTVEWSALERSLAEDPGPPSSNGTGSHEPVTLPEDEAGEPDSSADGDGESRDEAGGALDELVTSSDETAVSPDEPAAWFDEPATGFDQAAGVDGPAADAPGTSFEEAVVPRDRDQPPEAEAAPAEGDPDVPVSPRVARLRANRTAPGSRLRRRERPAAGGPRKPRAPKKPAERGPRQPGRARTWITRLVVPLLIVGVLAIGWFVVSLYQPFIGSAGDPVRVTVPAGLSTRQIGDLLADKGVVSSGFFFSLKARIDGNKGSLEAGTYTFRKGMSYEDAQGILLRGPPPIRTVSLRLPEGNTERDYASAVDKSGKVKGEYLRAVRRAKFNPRRYGAPAGSPLEGFLFPATYQLNKRDATARALVAQQLATFKRTFKGVSMRKARRANLTPYDVLIIASMVEREAQLPRERPVIAGVIYNRLRQSIPLGIDATIRYATNNWSRPILQSQLDRPGPYNTRLNQGLPPTPIGNPSLASIRAAANPTKTPYLFFVVKPGGNGAHAFSRTDAQFQRDVARYNSARAADGGRSPK